MMVSSSNAVISFQFRLMSFHICQTARAGLHGKEAYSTSTFSSASPPALEPPLFSPTVFPSSLLSDSSGACFFWFLRPLTAAAGFFAVLGATISSSEVAAFAALAFVEGFRARGGGFFTEALEGLGCCRYVEETIVQLIYIIRNLVISIEIVSDEM
jgi:hypothetical protein